MLSWVEHKKFYNLAAWQQIPGIYLHDDEICTMENIYNNVGDS